ncbi:MAG: hypothetical protein SGPRY_013415, partial [Prymnesium sp.]
ELEEKFPDFHIFVHHRYFPHPSGACAVASAEQALELEAEEVSYSRIASPRLLPPRVASAAGGELSEELSKRFIVAPSFVAARDKELAHSGLRMLGALEERGKAARGSPLKLLHLQRLEDRQLRGVALPVTLEGWHSYSSDLHHSISVDAGGGDEEMMLARLRAGIFGFPAELRSRALAASDSASSPTELADAVASFLEQEQLAAMLVRTTTSAPAAPHAVPHATSGEERIAKLEERLGRLEALLEERKPNTTCPAPSQARGRGVWEQGKHEPCAKWGEPGCDGRHFSRLCPLQQRPTPAAPAPECLTCDAEQDFTNLLVARESSERRLLRVPLDACCVPRRRRVDGVEKRLTLASHALPPALPEASPSLPCQQRLHRARCVLYYIKLHHSR